MQLTVTNVYEQEDWGAPPNGPFKAWYFGATMPDGNEGLFMINTKGRNTLQAGQTFEFEPKNGETVERNGYAWAKGKRAQSSPGNPGSYGQQPLRVAGNAPQGHSQKPAVTEDDVVAMFQRINAKLGVAAESGQATTIVLGLIRGDIAPAQPKPQPLPRPAAKPVPGYEPQESGDGSDDIPF